MRTKFTLKLNWQERGESNTNERFWRPPFYHWTTLLSGGEERIRTSGTGLPYNSLANCHLRPLGHFSKLYGGSGWTWTSEDRSRLIYSQVQLPLCDTPMYLLIISVGRIELPFSASKTGVLPLNETEILVPLAGVEPATPCSSGMRSTIWATEANFRCENRTHIAGVRNQCPNR